MAPDVELGPAAPPSPSWAPPLREFKRGQLSPRLVSCRDRGGGVFAPWPQLSTLPSILATPSTSNAAQQLHRPAQLPATGTRFKRRRATLRPGGPAAPCRTGPLLLQTGEGVVGMSGGPGHGQPGNDVGQAGSRRPAVRTLARHGACWCLPAGRRAGGGASSSTGGGSGSPPQLCGPAVPQILRYGAQELGCAGRGPRQGLAAAPGQGPQTGSVTTARRRKGAAEARFQQA